MFDTEKLLQSVSLIDLVSRAGGNPDRDGRCSCPLHGGQNDSAFHVYKQDGREYWKCFTGDCGHGDAIDFVKAWQGLDFKGACAFLGGDVISDPKAMEESARRRHEAAVRQEESARLEREARQKELAQEQLHLYYHETMKDWGRIKWVERGIDESYQNLWSLGSCDDKRIMFKGQEYHTPTLTIPLVNKQYELLNIKHRLINPPKENDKYRPERDGLGAFPPFFAWPDVGYDAEVIWIIEGEIKAMVAATISPSAEWQFIGIPGQDAFQKLPIEELVGKVVIVVPDPGAEKKAWDFAKKIRGRYISLPCKIDDMILSSNLDKNWLSSLPRQARMAK
jgi:hypothetical protein